MWYAAGEGYEPDVICYAESKDGKHWVKRTKPIKCADPEIAYEKSKVGACDVIRSSDNKYVMAYIAYQNVNVSRICLAYSDNPTDAWKKLMMSHPIARKREMGCSCSLQTNSLY